LVTYTNNYKIKSVRKILQKSKIILLVFLTDPVCDWRSFDDRVTWSRWCFYGWT